MSTPSSSGSTTSSSSTALTTLSIPRITKQDPRYAARIALLDQHQHMVQRMFHMRTECSERTHLSFGNTSNTGSGTGNSNNLLKELKPILLSELVPDKTHKGRVLFCRNISEPVIMSSVAFIVEDATGQAVPLSLYNYVRTDKFEEICKQIPKGCIFAIKDPYYRVSMSGTFAIRVDNPKNVSMLKRNDPLLQGIVWYAGSAITNTNNNDDTYIDELDSIPAGHIPAPKKEWSLAPNAVADNLSVSVKVDKGKNFSDTEVLSTNIPLNSSSIKVISSNLSTLISSSSSSTTTTTTTITTPTPAPALPVDSAQWRSKGKEYFDKDDLDQAIQCWEEAIKMDPNDILSYSNLLEAELRLGNWEKVIERADTALSIDNKHAKCLFRKAKALMGLARYSEAINILNSSILKKVAEAKVLHQECLTKQEQSLEGKYDWSSILIQTLHNFESRIDVAEYQSPSITVQSIDGKGLGIVANREIREGELLMVAKAIDIQFPSEVPTGDYRFAFHKKLTDSLKRRKYLKKQVLTLARNPTLTSSIESKVLSIVLDDLSSASPNDIITERTHLHEIIRTNSFKWFPWKNPYGGTGSSSTAMYENDGSTGLWLQPSRFNHSCLPNCSYSFIGDLWVAHALCDIQPNEEITIGYYSPEARLDDNRETVAADDSTWGFTCSCEFCTMLKNPRLPLPSKTLDWRLLASSRTDEKIPAKLLAFKDLCTRMVPDTEKTYVSMAVKIWSDVMSDVTQLPWAESFFVYPVLTLLFRYFFFSGDTDTAVEVLEDMYRLISTQRGLTIYRFERRIQLALEITQVYMKLTNYSKVLKWNTKAETNFQKFWTNEALPAFKELYPVKNE